MTDIGEEIINRLPIKSELNNKNNPMRTIILKAIGGWLQEEDDKEFLEQFFLQEATGKYLDLHGNDFGIKRNVDESDDDYRKRIIYQSLGRVTIDFLKEVYDVELYSYVPNYSVDNNTLTSDNPYYTNNGFLGVADETTQAILNKKFILGGGITWL